MTDKGGGSFRRDDWSLLPGEAQSHLVASRLRSGNNEAATKRQRSRYAIEPVGCEERDLNNARASNSGIGHFWGGVYRDFGVDGSFKRGEEE